MAEVGIRFVGYGVNGVTVVEAETPNHPECIGSVHRALRTVGLGVETASIRVVGNRVVQRLSISPCLGRTQVDIKDACLEAMGRVAGAA